MVSYMTLTLTILCLIIPLSITLSSDDCFLTNNLNSKIHNSQLIIRGRLLAVNDKASVILVLKVLKGFNIIGIVKKASLENDYHLILINNLDKMTKCKSIPKVYDDFILFLHPTHKSNIFKINYFDAFGSGALENKIIKILNGGFSRQVQTTDPCSKLSCKFGSQCIVWPTDESLVVCQCPNTACPKIHQKDGSSEKICGSDGAMYTSECEMNRHQCMKQQEITRVHMSICDPNYKDKDAGKPQQDVYWYDSNYGNHGEQEQQQRGGKRQQQRQVEPSNNEWCRMCPPYATCLAANKQCLCPTDRCDSSSRPMCGSDDITYSNICELKKVSCKSSRLITVQHAGVCDLCKFVECPFNGKCIMNQHDTMAQCVCPRPEEACRNQPTNQLLCGSDQRTYPSECHIKIASCEAQAEITVISKGPCQQQVPQERGYPKVDQPVTTVEDENVDQCTAKYCAYGAKCTRETVTHGNGGTQQGGAVRRSTVIKCKCDANKCSRDNGERNPVCADDGQTYMSKCLVEKAQCQKQRQISVLYMGECYHNPCNQLKCHQPFQFCRVNSVGQASCVCPDSCPPLVDPVCGSDKQSYDSLCHMKLNSCRNNKTIWAVYQGICSESNRCSEKGIDCQKNEICRSNLHETRCVCPTCPSNGYGDSVCGNDGKTYRSECHLRQTACTRGDRLEMVHIGACDACKGKKCSFYAQCRMNRFGAPQCICPTDCIAFPAAVCGTDGKTYQSSCYLRVKSCAENVHIQVAYNGSCNKCPSKCPYAQQCRNGKCVCIDKCDHQGPSVCGTNGKRYRNKCELMRTACVEKKTIHVDISGNSCPANIDGNNNMPGYNSDEIKNQRDSYACNCNPIGSVDKGRVCNQGRCVCKSGVSGVSCDSCADGYWGFSYSGCLECKCDKFGSISSRCNTQTGECSCKGRATGRYCSVCPQGTEMSNKGCTEKFTVPKIIKELSFSPDSSVRVTRKLGEDYHLLINITIIPRSPNGVVLYAFDDRYSPDYVSVVLRDLYVEFRLQPNHEEMKIVSKKPLTLGQEHVLLMERYQKWGQLQIDNKENVYGEIKTGLYTLDAGDSFYLGMPNYMADANAQYHTGGISRSFSGCLKSLFVQNNNNVHKFDMATYRKWTIKQINVKPYCNAMKDKSQGHKKSATPVGRNMKPIPNSDDICKLTKPCKNEGTCHVVSKGEFRCLCKPGYQGYKCESLVSPILKFVNNSFAIVPTRIFKLKSRLRLEIRFFPTPEQGNQNSGVLAFISDGQPDNSAFIVISLRNDRAMAMCRTAIGVTQIQSSARILAGKWNKLVVIKAPKYVYLKLNDSPNPTKERLIPKGHKNYREMFRRKLTQFRITNQPLFVGGVDDGIKNKYRSIVKLAPNFMGAIQFISINSEPVDFYKLSSMVFLHQVTQWQGSPCGPLYNLCSDNSLKTYCLPVMEKNRCTCPPSQAHLCNAGTAVSGRDNRMQHDNPDASASGMYRRFDGKSFAKFSGTKYRRKRKTLQNNIRFSFKTESRDGMLLLMQRKWSSGNNFLVVAIRNAVIELTMYLGGGKNKGIIRVTSTTVINDNRWHMVQVVRKHRYVALLVDNVLFSAKMRDDPSRKKLHTDGWIWLGGPKRDVRGFPWEYNQKFVGCMSDFYVNEEGYNLLSEARRNFGRVLKC